MMNAEQLPRSPMFVKSTVRIFVLAFIALLSAAALAQGGPPGRPGPGGPPGSNRPGPGGPGGPGSGASQRYVRHNSWRRGRRMPRSYWRRAQRVDYRQYRLSRPPRGYEWREVDGNFVLAAVATGLIASIIAASNAGG